MKRLSMVLVLSLMLTHVAHAFDAMKTEELLTFIASLGTIGDGPHERLFTDNKHLEILTKFVEEGADPNAQNGNMGLRAMSFTIEAGDLGATRYLIEKGAEILSELSYRDGLSIASYSSNPATMLNMLISYGASISRIRSFPYEKPEIIRPLLYSWLDIEQNIAEESLLHKALRKDLDEFIEPVIRGTAALERNALLNHKDSFGQTPLDIACILRKPKAIEILLKYDVCTLNCRHSCVQLASRTQELPKAVLNLLVEKTKKEYKLILDPLFKFVLTEDLFLLIIDMVVKSYMPKEP